MYLIPLRFNQKICYVKTPENQINQLIYKLYDLTPSRSKLSKSSMRGNKNACKKIIGIDENSNDIFGRDEQDLQDARSRRNPFHPVNPVKNLSEWTETLKTN